MTIQQLKNLYFLDREIKAAQQRIDELERLAGSPAGPNLTGMPRSTGDPADSRVSRLVCEIVDLKAVLYAKQLQLIHEKNIVERWIADIPDSLTRLVFALRFVHLYSWVKVACNVGNGMSESGVKSICYRYLKEHTEDDPVEYRTE